MRARHFAILPALAAAMLLVGPSAPARAQERVPAWGARSVRGGAYDNGYQRGYQNGVADARARRAADFRREHEYRDADWGYDRSFGSRDSYRQVFRDGFAAGYRDGYRRSGWDDDRRPLPQAPRYPDARGDRDDRYTIGVYGGYRNGTTSQVAFNYGYNDGYERGVKAARSHKRFDPDRDDWYRDGDRHYNSNYGPRDQYRATYREGFVRGYREGYGGRVYDRQ